MPHIYKIIVGDKISKQAFGLHKANQIVQSLKRKNIDARKHRFESNVTILDWDDQDSDVRYFTKSRGE
jgi:hypothetical protein